MGETVLHFLDVENDIEGVEWLHTHGASLNTANRFGTPMVFEVAAAGHQAMVLWLAQQDIDFSVSDGRNRSLFEYLRRGTEEAKPEWPTYDRMQARKKRAIEMEQFLEKNLPDVFKGAT